MQKCSIKEESVSMKNKYVIALAIDKVQTYLMEAIHEQVQEKEREEATLKKIMEASLDISENFKSEIKDCFFKNEEIRELLYCSGVYVFTCEIAKERIEEKLKEIFQHYYVLSGGKKIVRYTHFLAEGQNEIEMIQKAK